MGGGFLYIGFNRTGIFDVRYQRAILNISGRLELMANMQLGAGSRLVIGKEGVMKIQGNVSNSAGTTIICHDLIVIEDKTVISWDTLITDRDFHYLLDINTGHTRPEHKPIIIGKGVWICAGSKVLKGASMPDGSVLSAGSILSRAVEEKNCILMGNPAVVVKKGIVRSDIEV